MSDSLKVVLIFYIGFMLSLLIANILWGIILKSIDYWRRPKAS